MTGTQVSPPRSARPEWAPARRRWTRDSVENRVFAVLRVVVIVGLLTVTLFPIMRTFPPAISLAPAYATISLIGFALVVVTVRLRAVDLPRRGSYVFVLDDLDHDQMEALHAYDWGANLADRVKEWGAEGLLVFAGRVVIDEEVTPSGVAQLRASLEEALDISWTERPDRRWGEGRHGEGIGV